MRSHICLLAVLILVLADAGGFPSPAHAGEETLIEKGFNLLYQLKFAEARRPFADWQRENPKDPSSYEALATSYLFIAIRENQEDLARSQLLNLAAHFPENPLFQAELARLN